MAVCQSLNGLTDATLSGASSLPQFDSRVSAQSQWREYEGGDHAIMVGSVKNLIVPQQNAAPLVYCRGKMGALPMLA